MTIYFNKHFGMTRGVSNDFPEFKQNDGKWQVLNDNIEIPQDYDPLSYHERHLSFGFERVARIALGILCVIATLGIILLTEHEKSIRRCFTGYQVLIVVTPKSEKFHSSEKFDCIVETPKSERFHASKKLDCSNYFKLSRLPQEQIERYETIRDGIGNLTLLPLPEWNSDENVIEWVNSVVEAMKNYYPLQEERQEAFVVDYEAAAYGYMRDKIDRASIRDERKSILVCYIDQFMYQNAVIRKVEHQRARGFEPTYHLALGELAQRFYDACRAQGLSNLEHREDIRQALYDKDKQNGLAY